MGQFGTVTTGIDTSQFITKVTGATGNLGTFNVGGGLDDSGVKLSGLTGGSSGGDVKGFLYGGASVGTLQVSAPDVKLRLDGSNFSFYPITVYPRIYHADPDIVPEFSYSTNTSPTTWHDDGEVLATITSASLGLNSIYLHVRNKAATGETTYVNLSMLVQN